MQEIGLFVGYRSFHSEKKNKDIYVLDFLIQKPKDGGMSASLVTVFTEKKLFDAFVGGTELLSESVLAVEISNTAQGPRVFYSLAA